MKPSMNMDDFLTISEEVWPIQKNHLFMARKSGCPSAADLTHFGVLVEREALKRASLAQPASVPAGWKLVPVEPTPEMMHKAFCVIESEGIATTPWLRRTLWDTMLAAAPQAPQPAQAVQTFTEGHCDEKRKPGGCQLHNLHCGYPACDRKAAAPGPAVKDGLTYSSTQATKCAGCGKHKHTPLRIDAMGGYVCLTCIDRKLGSLLGEFGYEDAPQPEAQPLHADPYTHVIQHLNSSPYNLTKDECIELVRKLRDSAAPSAQAEPIAALVAESERLGLYDVPPLADLREKLGGWDIPEVSGKQAEQGGK